MKRQSSRRIEIPEQIQLAFPFRKRSTFHWPITLSAALMTMNIALMVVWIVFFAKFDQLTALTIGTIAFSLILVGLSFYLFLTIKEIRLNRRQANFVDSVTHELKSPIASLRLYLETLQMRSLDAPQRTKFYATMESELKRLDALISQLLEVGRLDAIGHETEPEDLNLEPLLRRCAATACAQHNCTPDDVFKFDTDAVVVNGRRIVLEMIFGNLFDNAVKYGAEKPAVDVEVRMKNRHRIVVRVSDNGRGVPAELRKKIFKLFYRGGSELERTRKGTGLGLYIVRTLVHIMKGTVVVSDRAIGTGSVFEIELPGRAAA